MNSADTILIVSLAAWSLFGLACATESRRPLWRPVILVFAILHTAAAVPRLIQLLLS